ncbi:hypothetical protein KAU11_12470 [Candidatus Babeliales bacterium]|nr:hypothetical protein [Candidatus Babeliales bacterium]
MQKVSQYIYFYLLAVLFLAGCAFTGSPQPETPKQWLAASELNYTAMLETMTVHIKEGRYSTAQITELVKGLDEIETGLNTAKFAIDNQDILTYQNQRTLLIKSMGIVSALLRENE